MQIMVGRKYFPIQSHTSAGPPATIRNTVPPGRFALLTRAAGLHGLLIPCANRRCALHRRRRRRRRLGGLWHGISSSRSFQEKHLSEISQILVGIVVFFFDFGVPISKTLLQDNLNFNRTHSLLRTHSNVTLNN